MTIFPSTRKRPLPDSKVESGSSTLSFYPDQPVYWEDKDKTKFALPEDAHIQTLKTAPTYLQGMLFKPETLKEHWRSPQRREAVNRLDVSIDNFGRNIVEQDVGRFYDRDDEDFEKQVEQGVTDRIANTRRELAESRMPTSLIHELADSGLKISPTPDGQLLMQGAGRYSTETGTVFLEDSNRERQGLIAHEIGHHVNFADAVATRGRELYEEQLKDGVGKTAKMAVHEGHAEGFGKRYTNTGRGFNSIYDKPDFWDKGEKSQAPFTEVYRQIHDRTRETGEMFLPTDAEFDKVFKAKDSAKATAALVKDYISPQFGPVSSGEQLKIPGLED